MILTCPACATSYFIPDDAMGSNGRKVRCQACGEVWRATGEEPLELTLAPEPHVVAAVESQPQSPHQSPSQSEPASETVDLAETPAPELPRAFRARAEQQRRLRRAAAHGVVWAGLASVFVGLIASAFLFRVEIVDALPRAASAYAIVGMKVNAVGLDFEALSAKAAPNAPGMVVVSGAIRNVRDAEIVAPPVRVALLDDHGAEIGFKIVRIDAAPVLPGKVQGFAALIPDPGGNAAGIGVDFAPVPGAEAARPRTPPSQHPAPAHEAAPAPSHATEPPPVDVAQATTPAPASGGLRSAVAPGVGGRTDAPIEARPVATVDNGHGEAVSAANHG